MEVPGSLTPWIHSHSHSTLHSPRILQFNQPMSQNLHHTTSQWQPERTKPPHPHRICSTIPISTPFLRKRVLTKTQVHQQTTAIPASLKLRATASQELLKFSGYITHVMCEDGHHPVSGVKPRSPSSSGQSVSLTRQPQLLMRCITVTNCFHLFSLSFLPIPLRKHELFWTWGGGI